ncbi:MAG TPA: alpha/beta hydrolase, partial [Acidovorax temperans]|nr:alpha/beta hydrolase [Acidovorax temperans]
MRGVLQGMARAGHPPLHTRTPEDARKAYEAGAGVLEVPKAALP